MLVEKAKLTAILDIIIDGVSLSDKGETRFDAAKELVINAMARYPHIIDKDIMKRVESILLLGADKCVPN